VGVNGAAAARMNVRAAEFFFRDVFANSSHNHWRPGDEELTRFLHHHREMRVDDAHRAQSSYRTHAGANHRNFGHQPNYQVPGWIGGNVSAPHHLKRLDAAASAGSIHQPDDWQSQLARESFAITGLVTDSRVCSSTSHRKIIAAYHHAPAVDARDANHVVRGNERGELAVFVSRFTRERAGFVK